MTVIKRDGTRVPFEIRKITDAMAKAFQACNRPEDEDTLNLLALRAVAKLSQDPSVEEIQDAVEQSLSEAGFHDVAKAYIIYRQSHSDNRDGKTVINYKKVIEDYVNARDWRVKENSTVSYSLGGCILNASGAVTANYWLSEVYDKEIAEAHRNCDMHLHDLSMLSPYCAGWSLRQIITEGIHGVEGRTSSAPPKHITSLCNILTNLLGIFQNEWAGAQAVSSLDTLMAPYCKGLPYAEVKQAMQALIWGLNVPSRWGTQAPFSNVTLDWTVPEDLKDLPAIIGGKEMDYTYGDCQKEMDMINKAFLEVMIAGDSEGRGFPYPIPTYSITKDFDWNENSENVRLLFEMTAKYGTPYFSNYVNSDMKPSDIRSMCCRLRLDLRELRRKNGGFFGSGDSTGSIGVVTINLPKIGYLSTSREDFYSRLDHIMDIAARSLKLKRDKVTELLERGLYPYTKAYLGSFSNHFSTIGLVGMNEACLNAKWLAKDMTDPEAQVFAEEVLNHMRDRLSDYQELYPGDLYNLEATPAESTAYRFAMHDRKVFPDIICAGTVDSPYYTNSTNLPVGYTDDLFNALDIQDRLQPLYTSGTVFHMFLGQALPDWRSAMNLVRKVCENYHLPYISVSPTYSVCPEHGYIEGEHFNCPKCGAESEVWSRVTGYYRPVKNWNKGKAQEFVDRKTYVVKDNETKANAEAIASEPAFQCSQPEEETKGIILVTSHTCPNCPTAKRVLDNAKIAYKCIVAEENADFVQKHGIMGVPTLIADGQQVNGVGPILGWVKARA